jgi:hypothetical protein
LGTGAGLTGLTVLTGLAGLAAWTGLAALTALVVLAALTAVAPFLVLFFSDNTALPDGTVPFLADTAGVSDDFCVLGMV